MIFAPYSHKSVPQYKHNDFLNTFKKNVGTSIRSPFRWLTGNDVNGLLFSQFFFCSIHFSSSFFPFSVTTFSQVDSSAQKTMDKPFCRPHQPFWGPLVVILERVPPSLQGWYFQARCQTAVSTYPRSII